MEDKNLNYAQPQSNTDAHTGGQTHFESIMCVLTERKQEYPERSVAFFQVVIF